jgi:hypothetical protein
MMMLQFAPLSLLAQKNKQSKEPLFIEYNEKEATEVNGGKLHAIGFGLGVSFIGDRLRFEAPTLGLFGWFDNSLKKISLTPAFSISYAYLLGEKFSIGGGLTYQEVELGQYSTVPYYNIYKYVSMKRLNVSVKFQMNYRQREKYHLYSGIRLGFNYNDVHADSSIEDWDKSFVNMKGYHYAVQIVALGMQVKVSPNIAFNTELCFGPPYTLYLGVMAVF